MGQNKNRYGLDVQPGEFIEIENGMCHILSCIEEWPDSPADAPEFRAVGIIGLVISQRELLSRVTFDRGFGELESEFPLMFEKEPIAQEVFDRWIDPEAKPPFVPISTEAFLEMLPAAEDGRYFVKFAKGTLCARDIVEIDDAWTNFKIVTTNAKPSAGVAANWIAEYVKSKPELDAPWIHFEMLTQISCTEEPCEWDGSKHPFVGKKAVIREMKGEPQYAGKAGIVTYVDDAGQLHGTWGGCALTEGDDYDLVDPDDADPLHYHDEYVDVRIIPEFCLAVFTGIDGKTSSVRFDDNFFSPSDLLKAYGEAMDGLSLPPAEKTQHMKAYGEYLIASGCSKEELE